MALDADIAAADALALERIKTQEYRNSCADLVAHRAVMREQYAAFLEWTKAEYAALPDLATETRLTMAASLAEKYFTTNTATLQESVDLDATNDARRFKAALEAAVAVVG